MKMKSHSSSPPRPLISMTSRFQWHAPAICHRRSHRLECHSTPRHQLGSSTGILWMLPCLQVPFIRSLHIFVLFDFRYYAPDYLGMYFVFIELGAGKLSKESSLPTSGSKKYWSHCSFFRLKYIVSWICV